MSRTLSTSQIGPLPQAAPISQADFVTLVNSHFSSMYRVAYRMVGNSHDAEDVVQDALRSAWNSRRTFDANRGQRAWLVAILRRRVIDRWRRTHQPPLPAGDLVQSISVQVPNPIEQGYSDSMAHALAQLPPQLRETLLLVVVQGYTHQEAADRLGVPLGTILSRVSRARGRLRNLLSRPERTADQGHPVSLPTSAKPCCAEVTT